VKRGRIIATLLTLAFVGGAVFVVLFVGARSALGPARSDTPGSTQGSSGGTESPSPSPLPTICPLSGLEAEAGAVPDRPAVAVKVENLPAARPQTGLSWADIVYEEPVEANITRFIAVYQCQDASHIEPIRSARLTDPDILVQFGRPLFAYAGGVPKVVDAIKAAGLVNLSDRRVPEAFHRDPNREAPHNLWTNTQELYAVAGDPTGIPEPVFKYAKKAKGGSPVSEIHIPFSSYSDVRWAWSSSQKRFLRFHGSEPHTLSDGTQVSSVNVIVQFVRIEMTDIVDVNGAPSPRVISTGSGRAYLLRGGKLVEGTWSRPSLDDVTVFKNSKGRQVSLLAGNTWVELVPMDILVPYS
jgi:hypothetical protein